MSTISSSTLPPLTLVLGGQRSGKSAYAEGLIGDQQSAVYLATGQVFDDEMLERVSRHQQRRPDNWITVEEPIDLAGSLRENTQSDRPVLIDSLAMWVSNLLGEGYNVETESFALVETLKDITSPLVIVSDETGLGIIPDNALARKFLDELGTLNQAIARQADRVVFIAAGLPLVLKG